MARTRASRLHSERLLGPAAFGDVHHYDTHAYQLGVDAYRVEATKRMRGARGLQRTGPRGLYVQRSPVRRTER